MRKYRFTSAALSELREATLYYEEKENGWAMPSWMRLMPRSNESSVSLTRGILSQREPDDAERTGFHSEYFIKSDLMKFLSPP